MEVNIEKIRKALELILKATNAGISNYRIEKEAFGYSQSLLPKFIAGKYNFTEANIDKLIAYLEPEVGDAKPVEAEAEPEEVKEDIVPESEQNQFDHDDEVAQYNDAINKESVRLRQKLDAIALIKGISTNELMNKIVIEYIKRFYIVIQESGL